jgi:hypothetical protein
MRALTSRFFPVVRYAARWVSGSAKSLESFTSRFGLTGHFSVLPGSAKSLESLTSRFLPGCVLPTPIPLYACAVYTAHAYILDSGVRQDMPEHRI